MSETPNEIKVLLNEIRNRNPETTNTATQAPPARVDTPLSVTTQKGEQVTFVQERGQWYAQVSRPLSAGSVPVERLLVRSNGDIPQILGALDEYDNPGYRSRRVQVVRPSGGGAPFVLVRTKALGLSGGGDEPFSKFFQDKNPAPLAAQPAQRNTNRNSFVVLQERIEQAMRPPSAETNTEKHIEYREDALSSLEIELSKKKEYLEVTSKTKKQELDERLTNKKEKNKQKQKASKDRVAKAEEEAKTAAQTAATTLQQATTAATAAEEKVTQLTEALEDIKKSQESEIEKATKALNDFITKYNEEHPKETPKSFPNTYDLLQTQLAAANAAKKRIEEEKGKGKTLSEKFRGFISNTKSREKNWGKLPALLEAQLEEKEREIELLNNLQTAQKPIEDQKVLIQIQTKKTKDKDPAQEALTIANRKQALAEQKLAKTKETEKAVQEVLEYQLQKEVDLHKSIEAEQKEEKEEKEKEKKRIEKEIRTVEKHLKAAKVANNNNKIVVVEGKIRELEKLEEEKKEALKEIIRERFKIAPKDVLNPSATNSEPEKIFKPLLQKAPKKLRPTLLEVATDIASELTSTSSTLIQPEAKKPSSKDTPVNDANTKKTTQQIRAKEIAKKPKSFLSSLKKLTRELSTTYNTLEDYKTTLGIAKTFDADKKIDNDQNLEARRKEREAFYNDPSNRANATYQNELQEHLLNALHQANIITSDVVEIKEERSAKAVCSFLELIGEEAPVPGAKTVTKFISAVIKCVSEGRIKKKAEKIKAVLSTEADVKDIVRALGYLLSKIHEKPDTYFKTGLAQEHAKIILNAISKKTVSRQKLEDPTFRRFALHLAEIITEENILKEQELRDLKVDRSKFNKELTGKLETAKKERQKDRKEIQTLKEQLDTTKKEQEEQKEKLEALEKQMERITRQTLEPSAAALKSAPPTIFSRTEQTAPEEQQILGTPEHKLEHLTEQWKTLEAQREIASEDTSRKQKSRKMEKLSKQLLQQHRKALKTAYQTLANTKVRGENWNQIENKIQESLEQTDTTELRAEVLEVKRKLEKQIAFMKAYAGRLVAISNEYQLAGKTKAALDKKLKNPRAQEYYYTLITEMNRLFMAASVAQTGYIAAQNKPGSVSSRASKLLKGIGKLVPNFGGYFEAAGEIAEGVGLHYTEHFLSAVAEIAHSPDEMNYIVKTVAYELVMNTPEDDLDAAQAREHMKQMITNFRETELGEKKHNREMIITLFLQALGHSQTATVEFKRKKPGLVKRGWKAFTSCFSSSGAAEQPVQEHRRGSQEMALNLVAFSGSAQPEAVTPLAGGGTTNLSTRNKHKM